MKKRKDCVLITEPDHSRPLFKMTDSAGVGSYSPKHEIVKHNSNCITFKSANRFQPQSCDTTVSPDNYNVHDTRNIKDGLAFKNIAEVDGGVFTKELRF